MIRFFCRMLPEVEPQLGFEYLQAIDQAKLEVRGVPLGPAFFAQKPWNRLVHLFIPAFWPASFVNMICVPPGFLLGQVLTGKMIAPDPRIAKDREKATDDVVYQPQKAVVGLYLDGAKNVAVVPPQAISLEEDEIEALKRYALVLCPSEPGAAVLTGLGIEAVYAPPEPSRLREVLAPLVSG